MHYRDNSCLDAWCHLREALRSFAVDAIGDVRTLEARAFDVPDADLDAEFGDAYGIFAGGATNTAVLRFDPKRARWVAREAWHPRQSGSFDDAGHYVLELPYSDDRELVMDILRFGADVEVLAPQSLRERVVEALAGALGRYRSG